jgi:hypothetical protein
MSNEPVLGTFVNALTGETVVRELTAEEHANYLEAIKDAPPLDNNPS